MDARQLLLPIYTLAQFLPATVTRRANEEGLKLVRQLVLQQDRFARREPLEPDDMRQGLDPLAALLALYESVRRGDIKGKILGALQEFFGELPDVAVAQQLLNPKKKASALNGIPLLRESLMRAPKLMEKLPLPAGLLDYGSIWTSWLGAVKSPSWKKK